MERRGVTRACNVEAGQLVRERGVPVAHPARDLGVPGTVLRRWVQEGSGDSPQAFPDQGPMPPGQLEIARLRREGTTLKAERAMLKSCGLLREGVAGTGGFSVKHRGRRPTAWGGAARGVSRGAMHG